MEVDDVGPKTAVKVPKVGLGEGADWEPEGHTRSEAEHRDLAVAFERAAAIARMRWGGGKHRHIVATGLALRELLNLGLDAAHDRRVRVRDMQNPHTGNSCTLHAIDA